MSIKPANISNDFAPRYIITSKIAQSLMRIESARAKILHLPLTPSVLVSLRETAKLCTTIIQLGSKEIALFPRKWKRSWRKKSPLTRLLAMTF